VPADVFQVLAEPRRRELLALLADEERTAADIAARFEVTRQAISQHLRILLAAGLIRERRDGARRWYQARPQGLEEVRAYLEAMWPDARSADHRHGGLAPQPVDHRRSGTFERVRVEIDWHAGPRSELRPLFELAEDSQMQLDRYLELGRVLVAVRGSEMVGHLQLVPMARERELELKNMTVVPQQRRTGVGRGLVAAALRASAAEGWSRMLVATGAADVGNLRFYQRLGFRLLSVERDAFTPATGYPTPIVIDGIPLRDRVWLSHDL
jgi:DNA-binding transcriptional ArsR family regulator/N-acetylglutamate synthase-like GNAT family acetyltransferase